MTFVSSPVPAAESAEPTAVAVGTAERKIEP
jgi:hypothetical protein